LSTAGAQIASQNRYYAMCVFILHIVANFSVAFDTSICRRYVPLQIFGEGIPLTIIIDVIIGLRVYALYGRNKSIAVILATSIIAEFSVSFWIYSIPSIHPVTLPGPASITQIPALHICLGSASSSLSNLQSAAYLFMQAFYDSITFGLIVYKTASAVLKERGHGGVRALMVKNGLVYYAIVFSAYCTWAMMTIFSPPGLKYAAASPTIMLACLSVNKLTLSLRQFYNKEDLECINVTTSTAAYAAGGGGGSGTRAGRRRSWIGTSTFEVTAGDFVHDRSVPSFESGTFELRVQSGGRRHSESDE